jgi:hypothetical protein
MGGLILILATPALIGTAVAVLWWSVRGRHERVSAGLAVRVGTVVATLLLLLLSFAVTAMSLASLADARLPREFREWVFDARFMLPLLAGIVALLILALPLARRHGAASADLAPRGLASFAPRRGVSVVVALAVLALLAALGAGVLSSPDESGHYTMYLTDTGVVAVGTSIYGWYYSVPCLVLIVLVLAVGTGGLALLVRPALADDREADIAVRRWRGRSLATVAAATIAFHLGEVFNSLAASASVHGSFNVPEAGSILTYASFAAFRTPFDVLGTVFVALGVLLCLATLLRALTPGSSRRAS